MLLTQACVFIDFVYVLFVFFVHGFVYGMCNSRLAFWCVTMLHLSLCDSGWCICVCVCMSVVVCQACLQVFPTLHLKSSNTVSQ